MFNKSDYNKINIIIPFLLIYFLIGIFIFDDYGISWDEPYHRINGFVALNSIRNFLSLESFPNLEHSNEWMAEQTKIYGSVFDIIASSLEKLFNLEDVRNAYLMKHLLNFLLFVISTFYFYKTLNLRFSIKLSILGILFFVLTPRIFAHSFFNMKDLVFLSFFIIALYYSIIFTKTYSFNDSIKAAISCAFLLLVKITGIIIPFIILFFFIFKSIDNFNFFKNKVLILVQFFIILTLLTISFWPLLWENPLENFIYALKTFINFNWRGGIYFFGEYISSLNLPWHYSITWILVTVPLLYLFNFIFGSFLILLKISKRFLELSNINKNKDIWNGEKERLDFIFFMIFYFTLFLVISFNSAMYTGWRHLFFIYPSLIFVSLRGVEFYLKKIEFKYLILIFIPFIAHTSYWMIKNHPYQNIYFNLLAGKQPNKNYELDYWGLSNRDSLNYLISKEKGQINLFVLSTSPYEHSLSLIHLDNRNRFNFVSSIEEADYLLTNHYYQKKDPIKYKYYLDNKYKLVNEIMVDNIVINSIYKK